MAPRSEPKPTGSQPLPPLVFHGSPIPMIAWRPTPRVAPVLQSAADKINNDDGYFGLGLCMRPEAKEYAHAKMKEDANWFSRQPLGVGAGVDDALCAVPQLVEDVWKGHLRPSSDRDAPGAEPGSYYRNSLSAKGEGVADLGQLAYDQTLFGMIDRANDGETFIERQRGKTSAKIYEAMAEGFMDDPARAVGSFLTGGLAAKASGVTAARFVSFGEKLAKTRALDLDKKNRGHVVSRHGPEISDEALRARVTTGYAPDGTWSPSKYSGRFNTYRDLVETYDAAIARLGDEGLDFSRAPDASERPAREVTINHGRPIDDGFAVPEGSVALRITPPPGKRGNKVWPDPNPVDGITATVTRVAWNAMRNRWEVVQHYPLVEGWDQATRSYTSGAAR